MKQRSTPAKIKSPKARGHTRSTPVKPQDHRPTTEIKVNRAPVLTLWATVVAERLGYDNDAALTLGKAVAGMNAQSKGGRIGIYKPSEKSKPESKRLQGAEFRAELLGRAVPVQQTERGVRAVVGDAVTGCGLAAHQ